jgi:hypothetical protein
MFNLFLFLSLFFSLIGIFLFFNKVLDFKLGHFEDAFNDVRRAGDDMIDVVFADLIVEFLENFFYCLIKKDTIEGVPVGQFSVG